MIERTDIEAMLGESIDLTAIDTTERRAWIPGLARFLRPGVPVTLFAPREKGKSLVSLILAEQVIHAGGSVAYIDFENGQRRTAERLDAILTDRPDADAARAAVAERLAYYPRARLAPVGNAELSHAWGEALGGFTVVIIDSLARALGQLNLDEERTPDVARFMGTYVDPLTARDVATVLLDNTGWDEQERSRGASGKFDLVELAYKVKSENIAPNTHGHIYLERKRTRDGDEAVKLEVGVGGGTYTRLEVADRPTHSPAVLDAVVDVLTREGHVSEDTALGYDRLRVLAHLSGDDKALRAQLNEAANDPETALRRRSNKRGFYVDSRRGKPSPRPNTVNDPPRLTGFEGEGAENGSTAPDSIAVDGPPGSHRGGRGAEGIPIGDASTASKARNGVGTDTRESAVPAMYDPSGEGS